ncbi:LamG domain-containing protein [Candidatus Poribacteria bacterium]|nr:LamG domain-containing protein [Candidatus Poribacteria bacterium]MYK92787.1 LamG domain-containing protein [Candidatus Poribacteria bacterium]
MRLIMYLLAVALLIAGSAMTTHAVVQDDGLILYFSFDAEEDGFVIDETGGGNDGIINGAEIATDEVVHGKGSLLCDANADGVTVDSFQALEQYTDNSYIFWLNFIVANSGGWDQIIAKKAPGSDRSPGIWTCNRVTLHIHYRFNPGNAGSLCVGPEGEGDEFGIGDWHHIAGVKEGDQFKFYIDGEVVDEQTVPAAHAQGTEKLYIGQTGYNSAKFYMDELFIYDRAVSAAEVTNIMEGNLTPVEPKDKLTTTWGQLKTNRD